MVITYALVSRYSSDANGNGNDGAHTDYWFNNALVFNQQAYAIDDLELVTDTPSSTDSKTKDTAKKDKDAKKDTDAAADKDTAKLKIQGWMASDAAKDYKYTYVIVLDANGGELGRTKVDFVSSDDVAKAFPAIANSSNCRFNKDDKNIQYIDLSADAVKKAKKDGIQLVLRYTNDKDGNGTVTVDQYTNKYRFNKADNKFVQA